METRQVSLNETLIFYTFLLVDSFDSFDAQIIKLAKEK